LWLAQAQNAISVGRFSRFRPDNVYAYAAALISYRQIKIKIQRQSAISLRFLFYYSQFGEKKTAEIRVTTGNNA